MSVPGVQRRSLKGRRPCAPLSVPNASHSDTVGPGLVEPLDGQRSSRSVALFCISSVHFQIDETWQPEKSCVLYLSSWVLQSAK